MYILLIIIINVMFEISLRKMIKKYNNVLGWRSTRD